MGIKPNITMVLQIENFETPNYDLNVSVPLFSVLASTEDFENKVKMKSSFLAGIYAPNV